MTRHLHGLELSVPEGAQDESLFRFVLVSETTPVPELAHTKKTAPVVRPSLVVARRAAVPGPFDSSIFEADNRAMVHRDRTFRVLASGTSTCHGRELVWQDVTLTGPGGLQIFQRHFVAAAVDGHQAVVTITTGTRDLDGLAARIGLSR
ncbi:MAG: hypothetical protein HY903_18990 [Deltaproteobacteria bacterium]|nr:hypothetical protein [Deltaproteobacteria bacterium]